MGRPKIAAIIHIYETAPDFRIYLLNFRIYPPCWRGLEWWIERCCRHTAHEPNGWLFRFAGCGWWFSYTCLRGIAKIKNLQFQLVYGACICSSPYVGLGVNSSLVFGGLKGVVIKGDVILLVVLSYIGGLPNEWLFRDGLVLGQGQVLSQWQLGCFGCAFRFVHVPRVAPMAIHIQLLRGWWGGVSFLKAPCRLHSMFDCGCCGRISIYIRCCGFGFFDLWCLRSG